MALLGNLETVNYTEGERKESSVSVEAESESVNQKMVVAPEHPALARLLLLEGRIRRNKNKVWKVSWLFPYALQVDQVQIFYLVEPLETWGWKAPCTFQ